MYVNAPLHAGVAQRKSRKLCFQVVGSNPATSIVLLSAVVLCIRYDGYPRSTEEIKTAMRAR
ncbi:hypothetical protein PF002_g18834 [Phytophthora fragariae]|uniref:Uncharacterized protein n=1 Tax=Phytophthora fragariae TaxID=53985 RepID=A0A6A3XYD2_9STRA|nr:hypothetical protein PF011_g13176 [Phytophthora fragariae]KAE9210385.1 hypothetical protein PF002_g18834 [Phytophthora fragariae]